MNSTIEKLLILQEHDSKLRDLLRQARDIPARKEEEKLRLKTHREAMDKAQENLRLRQADIKNVELEIKAKRDQMAKLRHQQFELKTNKEFKAMELEIHAVEIEISKLEDKELLLMEDVDLTKDAGEARSKALSQEQDVVDRDIKVLDERLLQVESEMAKIKLVRDQATAGIDGQWLNHYGRVFERREKAVVPLENGVCGGCHMKVPPQVVQNTRRQSSVMVTCDHCGRLLYSVY